MQDAMIATDAEARYAFLLRLLHWLIAVLVLGALAGGAVLWVFSFEELMARVGLETTNMLYTYHKTAGVLVLGLMACRLLVRLAFGAPRVHPSLSPGIAATAQFTHAALYALLIAMPVVGWAATAAGGFPVEFFEFRLPGLIAKDEALSATLFQVHRILAVAIGVILFLHIGAALRHWLVLRDGVMRRIALP